MPESIRFAKEWKCFPEPDARSLAVSSITQKQVAVTAMATDAMGMVMGDMATDAMVTAGTDMENPGMGMAMARQMKWRLSRSDLYWRFK